MFKEKPADKISFIYYALVTLLFTLLVFIASLVPVTGKIGVFSYWPVTYLLHFAEFLILGFLLFKTFYYYGSKNPYLLTFCIAILIALASEFIQLAISYRNFNPLDIGADGIGAFIALLVIGFTK